MKNDNSKYVVAIKKEDEYDEIFNSPHTCIINTIKKLDNEENDFFNMEYNDQMETYFYDDDSCFESIYTFGKLMSSKLKEIEYKSFSEEYNLTEYITKWLEINEYPYKETKIYPYFIYDSAQLYTVFEIHKWLIKIKKRKDEIAHSYSTTSIDNPELNNIIKLLKFIKSNNNLKFGETKFTHILFSPKSEEYKDILSKSLNDFSILTKNKKQLEKFIEATNLFLIEHIKATIQSRGIDFIVTTQQPIYNFDTTISLVRSANSIMGLAYDKLLLYLTAQETYKKEICAAKNCTNTIDKSRKNVNYCNNPKCQAERKKVWRDENKKKQSE